jgi:hypothetical protein
MSRFGFDQGGTGRFKAGKKFTNDTPLEDSVCIEVQFASGETTQNKC